MAKYELTRKAVTDLSEIWDYTVKNWSESQADRYYRLLTASFIEIIKKPDSGKNYQEIADGLKGYRTGQHIIFYKYEEMQNIRIIRILHNRMDLKKRIEEK